VPFLIPGACTRTAFDRPVDGESIEALLFRFNLRTVGCRANQAFRMSGAGCVKHMGAHDPTNMFRYTADAGVVSRREAGHFISLPTCRPAGLAAGKRGDPAATAPAHPADVSGVPTGKRRADVNSVDLQAAWQVALCNQPTTVAGESFNLGPVSGSAPGQGAERGCCLDCPLIRAPTPTRPCWAADATLQNGRA
jgi:hypothetical protein